jgi:hypothetical protein
MMSHVVTHADLLQGIMTCPDFQFIIDTSRINCISLSTKLGNGWVKYKIKFYVCKN